MTDVIYVYSTLSGLTGLTNVGHNLLNFGKICCSIRNINQSRWNKTTNQNKQLNVMPVDERDVTLSWINFSKCNLLTV